MRFVKRLGSYNFFLQGKTLEEWHGFCLEN